MHDLEATQPTFTRFTADTEEYRPFSPIDEGEQNTPSVHCEPGEPEELSKFRHWLNNHDFALLEPNEPSEARYKVRRKISIGGLPAVFEAQDELLDRFVLIIPLRVDDDAEVQINIQKIAGINSPIPLRIWSSYYFQKPSNETTDFANTDLVLVVEALPKQMEWLTHRQACSSGNLSPNRIITILKELNEVLLELNKRKVLLHLIPQMICYRLEKKDEQQEDSSMPSIRVMNVGLTSSRLIEQDPNTVINMSPEAIQGKSENAQSDIYTVAITAFELITHQPLFHNPNWDKGLPVNMPKLTFELIGQPLRDRLRELGYADHKINRIIRCIGGALRITSQNDQSRISISTFPSITTFIETLQELLDQSLTR